MKRPFFLICVSLTLFASAFAVTPKKWTLQECIDYALAHNVQTKQAKLNSELSKSRMQQSYAGMLPSINGFGNQNYNFGRRLDPFTNEFNQSNNKTNSFSLNSSVSLFNGFQLQNTRRQASFDYQSGKLDAEKTQNDVALNIITLYLQVLFNEENVQVAKTNADAMQKQLDRTTIMVNAGVYPLGTKLDLESQLANEQLRLVSAENIRDLSYLDLAQAMDLDSAANLEIIKPDLSKMQYTILDMRPEDIFQIASQSMPEIKSAELKVKSAKAGLAVAQGARSPQLTLNGALSTGYSNAYKEKVGSSPADSTLFGYIGGTPVYLTPPEGTPIYATTPFNKQLDQNFSKFVGLSVNVPIFNGWQVKTNIDRARISYQNAELDKQLTRNRLLKTIQQAHADALAALRRYEATTKSLQAMRESNNYTEQKFNLGVLNALDYLTAKNNMLKAESDLLQAQYEYIFKTKILDFYLGKPLAF